MKATNCNFSQIYSLYMDDGKGTLSKIDSLSINKPDLEIADYEGVIHRMWIITDENAIAEICDDFT